MGTPGAGVDLKARWEVLGQHFPPRHPGVCNTFRCGCVNVAVLGCEYIGQRGGFGTWMPAWVLTRSCPGPILQADM